MPCYSVPMVVNKLLKIMRLLPRIDAINSIFERIGLQYLSGIYVWILLPLSSSENQLLNLLPTFVRQDLLFLGSLWALVHLGKSTEIIINSYEG